MSRLVDAGRALNDRKMALAASTEGEPLLVLTPPVLEAVWSEALMLGALHRDLVEHAA
jgi:hypothetical protein